MCPMVTSYISNRDCPTHRESYQSHILEIQSIQNSLDIIGHRIILVAVPRLVRVAKAAQIYTNATVAMLRELCKLILEHLVVDRPAMDENNRLPVPISSTLIFTPLTDLIL